MAKIAEIPGNANGRVYVADSESVALHRDSGLEGAVDSGASVQGEVCEGDVPGRVRLAGEGDNGKTVKVGGDGADVCSSDVPVLHDAHVKEYDERKRKLGWARHLPRPLQDFYLRHPLWSLAIASLPLFEALVALTPVVDVARHYNYDPRDKCGIQKTQGLEQDIRTFLAKGLNDLGFPADSVNGVMFFLYDETLLGTLCQWASRDEVGHAMFNDSVHLSEIDSDISLLTLAVHESAHLEFERLTPEQLKVFRQQRASYQQEYLRCAKEQKRIITERFDISNKLSSQIDDKTRAELEDCFKYLGSVYFSNSIVMFPFSSSPNGLAKLLDEDEAYARFAESFYVRLPLLTDSPRANQSVLNGAKRLRTIFPDFFLLQKTNSGAYASFSVCTPRVSITSPAQSLKNLWALERDYHYMVYSTAWQRVKEFCLK